MRDKTIFAILVFMISWGNGRSQESQNVYAFDFHKLDPIVQVFAGAKYNLNQKLYDYQFGRAHLGFRYAFNKNWSAKIIIDRGRPTQIKNILVLDSLGNKLLVNSTVNEGAYYTMFLKFASLRWNINDKISIESGAILQNHYITQEKFWGFRYVAQTFQDLYWHLPSSDLGFIAFFNPCNTFGMDISLTNGEGPRIRQDELGNIKMAAGLDIKPRDWFTGRIYAHSKSGISTQEDTEKLFSVFTGFNLSARSRMGGEFNYMNNLQNIPELNSYGYSLFGAMNVASKLEIFVRFDRLLYDLPAIYKGKGFENLSAIIAGVSINLAEGIHCSLNYHGVVADGHSLTSGINMDIEYKF